MKNPNKVMKVSGNLFNPDSHVLPPIVSESFAHIEKHGTEQG